VKFWWGGKKHRGRNGNMGREEQIEEREVLDSIFPDEITGIHIYLLWPYDLYR